MANIISALNISKLGHDIHEIRQRALYNLISKLDNGFVFDNELARTKELLTKLFEWFLFDPCGDEEVVFGLIKYIFKSETGSILIRHYGRDVIKNELQKVRTCVEPKFFTFIDELLALVEKTASLPTIKVPPLQSEVPLSYRSNQTAADFNVNVNIGSSATPIEDYIHCNPSLEQQSGQHSDYDNSLIGSLRESPQEEPVEDSFYSNYTFNWQPLIVANRHVLQSIEVSLKDPSQPATLLHSCEFFVDVLLQDFPAEIFLQRPAIILFFYKILITCPSTRVTNAALEGLLNLTKNLQVRINQKNDPSMFTSKKNSFNRMQSMDNAFSARLHDNPKSSSSTSSSGEELERTEDILLLKEKQMSLPQFCLTTMQHIFKYLCIKANTVRESAKRNINQVGLNLSLALLNEVTNLLKYCLSPQIWISRQDATTKNITALFNEVLVEYGDALEYLRLEYLTNDSNLNYRAIYLHVICICGYLLQYTIPLEKCAIILPNNFKMSLSHSLIDVTLSRLYPKSHRLIFEYTKHSSFNKKDNLLTRYNEVEILCDSLTAAVKLLKSHKSLQTPVALCLAKTSLPSLEFHMDLKLITYFIDICANQLPMYSSNEDVLRVAEDVTLSLLSHNVGEIEEEMYRLCKLKVISAIGPKLNTARTGAPGSQVLFLLTPKIVTEISLFGITSKNLQVQKFSDSIIIHILKCKILVSEEIWHKVIQALLPSLAILLCHCDKSSVLGKNLLGILDPDNAERSLFPTDMILKGNIELLFSKESIVREEAASRICWLLSSDVESRDMLPRLNNLNDTSLSNVCQVQKVYDLNRIRATEHFYQPSSLLQVIDLLNSVNVEPVIRRSALTQLSVMMEDPILHQTFFENNGLETVIDVMKSALTEKDFRDYPDSVVPAISILKNIVLYNATSRFTISGRISIYHYILRGLFMFFTEERLRQDASILLFILIFNGFCKGSPSNGSFSIPFLGQEKLNVPFKCLSHWQTSQYCETSQIESISSDKWCLSSLQIQWNAELFGGFKELYKWNEINYTEPINDLLKLDEYDLKILKFSSCEYCIEKYLLDIQNGTSHNNVMEAINKLSLYIQLYHILQGEFIENLLPLQWEQSFIRFFRLLPSSEEDVKLLITVVNFLMKYVTYFPVDLTGWVNALMKDPLLNITDAIFVDSSTTEESKVLGRRLLKLITICVVKEQNYLQYFPNSTLEKQDTKNDTSKGWSGIINSISESLKFNDAQHFYNLAYLDALLSCLVHLTAMLGWSCNKPNTPPKPILKQTISGLSELIHAFHIGKGPTAPVSLMGLSIIRHVILILNNLLAELQFCNVKAWEQCFILDSEHQSILSNFSSLILSRDVIVRAATLQFFSGLVTSPRCAIELVNEIFDKNISVWRMALDFLTDQEEACIVKENAAMLLANLTSHVCRNNNDKLIFLTGVDPYKNKPGVSLSHLLEEYKFYKMIQVYLTCLFTNYRKRLFPALPNGDSIYGGFSERSWNSTDSNRIGAVSTPGLVRSVVVFLARFHALEPERLCSTLQEMGLIKMIFKCLCIPNITLNNSKEFSLYCDILEMNTAVCGFLSQTVTCSGVCFGTVLHTKDCLNIMLSLLNPKIYYTHMSQLVYLRNKLWSEVFHLIGTLIERGQSEHQEKITPRSLEALSIISDALVETGREPFLESLCEAIGSIGSNELQISALTSLTSLLKVEVEKITYGRMLERSRSEFSSMQSLLDTIKTPRSVTPGGISDSKGSEFSYDKSDLKINLLEDIYFGKMLKSKTKNILSLKTKIEDENGNNNENLMAGAELCKILLHLYELCSVSSVEGGMVHSRRGFVVATLTSILCVSNSAKKYALDNGLMQTITDKLKKYYAKLSLESADCLKRVADRKRILPVLRDLIGIIGLVTNFLLNDGNVKLEATDFGLADLIHKHWVWFTVQKSYLIDALHLLCTFTADCERACQSLLLTSTIAGTGPRKVPSNMSLLHAIVALLDKEMDQVSKTHDLTALELSLNILHNCSSVLECRNLLSKTTFLQSLSRLHPAITKRQKPWDLVESLWLKFLQTFTFYPEGQICVAKFPDAMEVIMSLASNSKINKQSALLVLRNISFHQPNRPRLLASGEFLNILQNKLHSGNLEEINVTVVIVWALAANSQKAKLVLKSAQIDQNLQDALKHCNLLPDSKERDDILERMWYVYKFLKDGDKCK